MISLSDFNRFLNPIKRKIFLMLGKALLTAVNNTGDTGYYPAGSRKNPQRVTIVGLSGETLADVERVQEYGFETYPIPGTAKGVLASPDGSRNNSFVVAVQDDTYRPSIGASGDVILYNAFGAAFRLINATGKIEITGSTELKITLGDLFADLISLKTHFHQGNLGFPTGVALESGGGTTPSSLPSTNDAGNIIDGGSKNLSTHTHTQANDSGGSTEQPTSVPV